MSRWPSNRHRSYSVAVVEGVAAAAALEAAEAAVITAAEAEVERVVGIAPLAMETGTAPRVATQTGLDGTSAIVVKRPALGAPREIVQEVATAMAVREVASVIGAVVGAALVDTVAAGVKEAMVVVAAAIVDAMVVPGETAREAPKAEVVVAVTVAVIEQRVPSCVCRLMLRLQTA